MDNAVHRRATDQSSDSTFALSELNLGSPLEPGGVYLDLARITRGPFVAVPGQVAGSRNRYVARRDVSCASWRHLIERPSALSMPALGNHG